jgi:uncharacterized membrane protein YfcA
MDFRLSIAGLVVGIFVGLSGVGGSAIMAPMLILVLGVKPTLVIGTDLLYSVPTKIFALYLHQRQGTIDPREHGCYSSLLCRVRSLESLFAFVRAHLPVDVF